MSNIEDIVRPFQTPNYAPSAPYYPPGKAAPTPIILEFGKGGGGKVMGGSASYSTTFYCTAYSNEKKNAPWGIVGGSSG